MLTAFVPVVSSIVSAFGLELTTFGMFALSPPPDCSPFIIVHTIMTLAELVSVTLMPQVMLIV